MAIKVVLTSRSQETGSLSSVGDDAKVRISRSVYQELRSLAKNKNISHDYVNKKIPTEIAELYKNFNYIYLGEQVDPDIKKLDEYLGSLGISQTYAYSKDTISIEPWIDFTSPAPIRNVVKRIPLTNIIDRTTGYNVVHDTTK